MGMEIRKTVTIVEDEVKSTGSRPAEWRVAAVAIVKNPLATGNDDNLSELVNQGEDLGRFLAEQILQNLKRNGIVAIGKAAIVGSDGEPEHAQSILYPKLSNAVRSVLELPAARMFGDKKLAQAGATIAVSLYSVAGSPTDQSAGSMEIRVPGSPAHDEILVALVAAGTGSRA